MISTEGYQVLSIFGKFAERIVRAFYIIDGITGHKILIELPRTVKAGARRRSMNLSFENPSSNVVASVHERCDCE